MQDTIITAIIVLIAFLAGRYYGRRNPKTVTKTVVTVDDLREQAGLPRLGDMTEEQRQQHFLDAIEKKKELAKQRQEQYGNVVCFDTDNTFFFVCPKDDRLRGLRFTIPSLTEGEENNQQNGQDEPQTNQK